jgi:hypothetical protein
MAERETINFDKLPLDGQGAFIVMKAYEKIDELYVLYMRMVEKQKEGEIQSFFGIIADALLRYQREESVEDGKMTEDDEKRFREITMSKFDIGTF